MWWIGFDSVNSNPSSWLFGVCTGDPLLLLLLLLQSEAVSADINPLFVHAGPAFIKNVRARVWKCIVECARVVIVFCFVFFVVLVLAVTDCLPSPTSGVCRHPRHILPQMQSHFRNVILFFFYVVFVQNVTSLRCTTHFWIRFTFSCFLTSIVFYV